MLHGALACWTHVVAVVPAAAVLAPLPAGLATVAYGGEGQRAHRFNRAAQIRREPALHQAVRQQARRVARDHDAAGHAPVVVAGAMCRSVEEIDAALQADGGAVLEIERQRLGIDGVGADRCMFRQVEIAQRQAQLDESDARPGVAQFRCVEHNEKAV